MSELLNIQEVQPGTRVTAITGTTKRHGEIYQQRPGTVVRLTTRFTSDGANELWTLLVQLDDGSEIITSRVMALEDEQPETITTDSGIKISFNDARTLFAQYQGYKSARRARESRAPERCSFSTAPPAAIQSPAA